MAWQSRGELAGLAVAEARERAWAYQWSRGLWHFVRHKQLGALGGLICLVLLILAIFAPLIAPYSYAEFKLVEKLQRPSASHWLGTDQLGRDMFTRIVYGARTTATVGFGAVAITFVLSALLGIATGFYGGYLDLLVQRAVDAWMAFPGLILAISLIGIVGPNIWVVTIVIGLLWVARGTRLVRSAVLSMREQPFVEAARVVGSTNARIMLNHIFPNVLPILVVFATLQIGAAILIETQISFLGYGIRPPVPSWGQMLSGDAIRFMILHPIMAVWPGIAITAVVFGFNVFGDALRDVLDPRLRGGGQ